MVQNVADFLLSLLVAQAFRESIGYRHGFASNDGVDDVGVIGKIVAIDQAKMIALEIVDELGEQGFRFGHLGDRLLELIKPVKDFLFDYLV